jgi:hypothetical protein
MSLVSLLKSKSRAKEVPHPEVVEREIPIVLGRYQVRMKDMGREIYLETFLKSVRKPKDRIFSRFYLLDEHPLGLQFAPTLEKALDWFAGTKYPKDGYLSIAWGHNLTFICGFCDHKKTEPFQVTKVEKVILSGNSPFPWKMEGWRVSEIETQSMGKGNPSKIIDITKIYPVIKWHSGKNRYICHRCADQFKKIGREEEVTGYAIFPGDS